MRHWWTLSMIWRPVSHILGKRWIIPIRITILTQILIFILIPILILITILRLVPDPDPYLDHIP